MSNDPAVLAQQQAAPTFADVVAQAAAPVATQVATQVAQKVHEGTLEVTSALRSDLTSVQAQVADIIATQGPAIGQQAVVAIKSSIDNAAHDVWLPRLIVGIFGLAGLIILAAYVAGSHQAADIWVWLVATFGGTALVGGRMLLATILGPKNA